MSLQGFTPSGPSIAQLPHTHFTKRIRAMSQQAVPVRPARKVRKPKKNLAPVFFSSIPTVIRRQTPQTTEAPTAKSNHTHHSKSLGLKGICGVYHRAAGGHPIAANALTVSAGKKTEAPKGKWVDSSYCWVVICKNHWFHRRAPTSLTCTGFH